MTPPTPLIGSEVLAANSDIAVTPGRSPRLSKVPALRCGMKVSAIVKADVDELM